MKKLLALSLLAGTTLSLSACGGVPECIDELDECNRGGAYTEERTTQAGRYRTVLNKTPAPAPAPAPAPVKQPAPAPVYQEPEPVVDTQVMRSAEPEFKQISK